MLESSVQQALDRRGMTMDPRLDLQALIDADSHFIVDCSTPESEHLVRISLGIAITFGYLQQTFWNVQ